MVGDTSRQTVLLSLDYVTGKFWLHRIPIFRIQYFLGLSPDDVEVYSHSLKHRRALDLDSHLFPCLQLAFVDLQASNAHPRLSA